MLLMKIAIWSLSVSNINNNIEWSGQSINTIFADRKRIFDINFLNS